MAKESFDTSYLTFVQRRVLKELDKSRVKYKVIQYHANGDLTIQKDDGSKYTITEGGETVEGEGIHIPKTPPKTYWGASTPKPKKAQQLPLGEPPIYGFEEEEYYEVYHPPKSKPSKEYFTPVTPSKTVCQEKPECCKPREIKHVAFDADHTIWGMGSTIASSVTGKLCKLDDNTVVELKGKGDCPSTKEQETLSKIESEIVKGLTESEKALLGTLPKPEEEHTEKTEYQTTITLLPTFLETLTELEKRGISRSIISLNTPGSVKRILETFGIADKFAEIRDSFENKGKVFAEQTQKLGVCPCNAAFVDDRREHTEDVSKKCGLAIQIGKGKDIEKPFEIMRFIKD